jgi:D-glycero-D-manno-heptose 1,7-bisphosphate phosphatase
MTSNPLRAGAIIDRDGTLIDVVRDEETGTVHVAFHPSQIRLMPGVLEGLAALRDAGYALCIATNQPGPAKGQYGVEAVTRTNRALLELLAAEGIEIASLETCMHHPEGGPGGDPNLVGACDCRKPAPGLLLAAIAHAGLDVTKTWMIGDAASDVEAARRANLRSALVFPLNRCEICPLRSGPNSSPDLVAPRFDELVARILAAP